VEHLRLLKLLGRADAKSKYVFFSLELFYNRFGVPKLSANKHVLGRAKGGGVLGCARRALTQKMIKKGSSYWSADTTNSLQEARIVKKKSCAESNQHREGGGSGDESKNR